MTQHFDATFQGGALYPVQGIELPYADGDRVQVSVSAKGQVTPGEVLGLARAVYAGLSAEEIDDLERIALDRSNFFDRDVSVE